MNANTITLDEARQRFFASLDKLTPCPCCERLTKKYRRKLNRGMAKSLLAIYRLCGGQREPVHVTHILGLDMIAAEYSKLRYWDLLEHEPNGLWKLTVLGQQFVQREVEVQKYVYLINSRKVGQGGELISIDDALGETFDFDELMECA